MEKRAQGAGGQLSEIMETSGSRRGELSPITANDVLLRPAPGQ